MDMIRSFQNLLWGQQKANNSAALFSFTPYRILREPNDTFIKVNKLDSNVIVKELENSNNVELAKYYQNIKEDFETEFGKNNNFDAVCFHNSTNVIVTLSKVQKESIKDNSVICIRV